jgi:hypothetical protein
VRLGYLFVPTADSPDYHFFAKPPQRPRTHHLHVCEAGSHHDFRHVAVRDFLRAHTDEAARYAGHKRQVIAGHPQDRLAYVEGKDDYLSALEDRAVAWARARRSRSGMGSRSQLSRQVGGAGGSSRPAGSGRRMLLRKHLKYRSKVPEVASSAPRPTRTHGTAAELKEGDVAAPLLARTP